MDRLRPTQGAHRIISVVLVSGLMCLYFPLLRVLYDLFEIKVPDIVLYGIMVGIVAFAWYGLKSWQFGHLRAAQAAVPRRYSRSQIKFRGRVATALSITSIWVLALVSIGTIKNYAYWP